MSMKPFFSAARLAALTLGLAISTAAVPLSAADGSAALAEKPKAPEWTAKGLDGQLIRSADFKDKVVVVDFWATWCGPCVSEIPGYVELQKQYGDKGLVFVGLSIDEGGPEVVRKFVKAHKVNYTVAMAGDDVQGAFGGFEAIPTTFVISRDGRIAYKKTGSMKKSEFEEILKPLLK